MSVQQVYIVRHGETDYNVAHRWQGQLQIPLNANGRAQAHALRDVLVDVTFTGVYSSDLIRAYDTARIITEPHNVGITAEPRFREMLLGVFQGKTRDELHEQYPTQVEKWNIDDSFAPDGGESRLTTRQRALAAWQAMLAADDAETLLMVTHGGVLRMLMPLILDDPQLQREKFGNTSLTHLRRSTTNGHRWQVVRLNDTTHLG